MTIWPSISLIKHNDFSVPNQGIDSNDDDIKDYDNTVDFYHSRKIIKQIDKSAKYNNAIAVRTGKKFNLTVIDLDNIYLTFELFQFCYQSAPIITKTSIEFHFYYQYKDKLKNENRQDLGYDVKNNTNVTIPLSYYEYIKNGENKIFTYKFIKFSFLKLCPQKVIDIINLQNKQQVFYILDNKKLTD